MSDIAAGSSRFAPHLRLPPRPAGKCWRLRAGAPPRSPFTTLYWAVHQPRRRSPPATSKSA